ncbi:MAG: hypothetical protein WAP35_07835 [Solirubrobacterales bacterium]
MTPLIAHASHWLAGLLYLAPVLVLAAGIAWQRHADRRDKTGENS